MNMIRKEIKRKGILYIISAPSGAGKTMFCKYLPDTIPSIRHSTSYTTRMPRPGEVHGTDYFFIRKDEFNNKINSQDFLEWANVHDNLYGTSKSHLNDLFNNGYDVLLDIDVQGAKKIRDVFRNNASYQKQWSHEVFIFILPPSIDELKRRLSDRLSDSDEVINKRVTNSIEEIKNYKDYDYVIINDNLLRALEILRAIVIAEKNKTEFVDKDWIENEFRNITGGK